MVSFGSKALPSRRSTAGNLIEDCFMGEERKSHKQDRREKGMGRKAKRGSFGFDGDDSNKNVSGMATNRNTKVKKSWKHQQAFEPETLLVRKQVDAETAKYFSEIANLLESNEVELEERSNICGNALEETRGKELEVATDYIISHTLQTLLEGCDVDHLCGFLRSCSKVFPYIAMDRSGSHVAETGLKSLSMHLEDAEAYSIIEETLTKICEVMVINPVDVMCNCYGSHVLRKLLCLCKGVPLDSSELHGAKSSKVLAVRLNFKASRLDVNDSQNSHQGFPDLLNLLISGILKCARKDNKILQVDQYSSLVLQMALKLLVGHDQELLQTIPILLGCKKENLVGENYIETDVARDVIESMQETAFSHLMEVILEVAPESLYNEMFNKVFRNSLYKLSSHHCGNFVVQALVSQARSQDQMELIWEELGSRLRNLLEMGRSGVIASLIAASQRLNTLEHKCFQALAAAVASTESPACIVPRILFLDSYFGCEDKSNWKWPSNVKMHVMGSLILQEIFRFQSGFAQPYIVSITSMEPEHVFEAAKDAGGARVLEAFLGSNAPVKQKRRLVMKLRGHFGELSLQSSGSFTVEKCFNVSNMSLREAIASELLAVRTELSKTKQGPHLLRKLDIEGFAAKPDQWRSRQTAKQSAYRDFYAAFGSSEVKSSKEDTFLSNTTKHTSKPQGLKQLKEEIDQFLPTSAPSFGMSGSKRLREEDDVGNDDSAERKKKSKKKRNVVGSDDAIASTKMSENAVGNKRPFLSEGKLGKKRHRKV